MQPDRNRELIRMFVERILQEVFAEETGAARLQQIGLFTLIYMLEGDEEPVTVSRLMAMTGQSDSQIIRHLRKLMKLDLIERRQILNKLGRGRAFHLTIKHNDKTRRLAQAIAKATTASAGRKRRRAP
jgi:predicted transcriptional regulator